MQVDCFQVPFAPLADIETVETAINEIVASGLVGVSSGGPGAISVSGAALTTLLDRKKELQLEMNSLTTGSFLTLDYDIDDLGEDQSEYLDG